MTWRELDDFLSRLQKQFPRPQLQTWGQAGSVIALLEEQTSAPLDEAIREFARKRIWRELTPDEQAMLGFRVDFAWHIVAALGEADPPKKWFPTEQWSDSEQLEWALITAWQWPGAPFWERVADTCYDKACDEPPETTLGGMN